MYKWSDEQVMLREAVRRFIEAEIVPHVDELEHGDLAPYDLLRKFFSTFGMDFMARDRFKRAIEKEKAIASGELPAEASTEEAEAEAMPTGDIMRDPNAVAFTMIPIIELCRHCPGMVTAMGVSMGLTGAAVMSKGTTAQKERWGLDLLTLEKIGAWAITEPNSGSDAFGSMQSTARRDGDEYILNGSKTFITNGPYADTIVFICKLDEGNPPAERKVLQFVLDKGMPGLEQSKPLRKMGLHSSPTGELFLSDVRVGKDRLLGGTEDQPAREASKDTFSMERTGVAAMALGIVERCLELCVDYAKNRVQFGQPIGEFQLIQLKLAKMEVARMNLQNMVFRFIETTASGESLTLAEASAMKLYSAQAAVEVALEAVQLFGGNGYMAEFRVEQLARDAKVLQIYAGTDEIQVSQIARSLLA
ncbi:MAG: Acyl-CoA dehydrogenase [Acidimicrobiales bacterium]|nr:MAG: acyl-CoA dehydrogenase [Actinomycetota bacterium]MBV6507652.1 Acyl-CoA dehydrogenase [Acidimicrobiales bacterium]RIK07583.1 MAG: acyl-CoA dehydrogenase [Acidobacteriota bacterium]